MSSKTKKIIEIQKSFYEAALLRRQAELKNRGVEDAKITKDTQLRHLKAKLRQANRRLLAVSEIERWMEQVARRKREGAEKRGQKTGRPSLITILKKTWMPVHWFLTDAIP